MKVKHLIVSILYGLGLILAVLWLLAGGPASPVYADTFTVTNTAQSGPGSLRQAILDANDHPGHDVIDFGITGTLSPWLLPVIDDDLTITGPGATQLAVSGGNVRRVFEIAGGTAVTITGLTVCDGYALDYGGGIFSAGDLLLQNVRVLSSTAPYGGGIYISQGNATLNATQVFNNDANEGGGLYIAQGNVMLGDTQVLSNAAGYGGGIYLSQGNATLAGTQVFNNEANEGGGLFIAQGNVTLSDTQVRSNAAGHGGGVYADSSSITLTSSGGEISSNSAITYGGGAYVVAGNVVLTGTQISNNVSSQGGGVYVNAGLITLHSAHVAGNYATFGGGIHIAGGNVALNDTQLVSNTATSGGGGVSLFGSSTMLSVSHGSMNYNSATQGGGLYVLQGHATVQGTQILGNKVFDGGGGVDILYGDATLNAVKIIDNSSNQAGGGVHLRYSNAVLAMNGGEIRSNTAITTGGGVHVAAGHATLGDVQILDNAAENGGGLFSNGGYVTVTQSLVAGNQATGAGGGVCALAGFVTLTGTQVLGNAAGSEGGGVFVWEGLTTIDHTQLSHNAASTGGAGVTVHHGAAILNDSQVFSNTAPYGGGVYGVGGDAVLNRTQVFENAGDRGGGISIYQGNVILNETHVFGNSANNGGGVYIDQHPAMLTMNGGEIRSNTAITSGGGVYMLQGRIALSETRMSGNLAADAGGGMYVHFGDATLNGTQILSNTANQGGGVFIARDNATLNANRGEIGHNVAADAGGGVFADDGNITMAGTQIFGNSAANDGGGLYLVSASATLTGTQVLDNSATSGGGLYVYYASATLTNTQLCHNVTSGNGGGIYIAYSGARLNMAGGVITHNAGYDGGGAYINYDYNLAATSGNGVNAAQAHALALNDVTISHNTASHSGGGVYVYQDIAGLNMIRGEISSNTAAADGGGVYVNRGSAELAETQLLSNTAAADGGGVFVNSGRARLVGMPLIGNIAGGFGGGGYVAAGSLSLGGTPVFSNSAHSGGGLYVENGEAWLDSAQMQHNTADYGGGIAVQHGHARLERTQMSDNEAALSGGGLYVYEGSATLDEMQIAGNHAPDGSALYAGGVITSRSALTLTGDVYQVGGRFAGSAHDLRIAGALVLAGGDFYAPDAPNTLTLTGRYTHTGGTYHQTKVVDGDSDVGFPKEGGLFINANNIGLGSTQVADTAGDDCVGITGGEAVSHCYGITPTVSIWGDYTATLTLYYQNAEAKPGHNCSVMEAYAWDGAWDTLLARDGSYGNDGRLCGSDPQSIRVLNVSDFPTFTLRGPAPEIVVAPLALDFGAQAVDAGPTPAQMVTITNTGLEDLHVTGIALTGDDVADFAITGGGEPVTLTTGQPHPVHIIFDPVSPGGKTATLTIHSDDADDPTVAVALSGTGVAPEITVAPLALDFGVQDVDAGPTIARQVTLTNDGNADLHVTGIALTGAAAADFLIESGGEVVTLTPGNAHAILLAFDPSTMGAKSAELQIQSDDGDEPTVTVALSGAGAAAPEIVVAPLALDFGEQDVDAGPAPSQTVTIANVGSTDLQLTAVGLTGADAMDLAIADDTGEVTLTPGATRTVHISFDPVSPGGKSASLSIQSDDADESTVNVALAGVGTTATFPLTASKDGAGQGHVSSTPAGINCGEACQAGFAAGAPVTLTATTGTGFVFVGWQGAGCSGTGACHVMMDAARHVTATFDVAPGYPGYGSTPTPGSAINVGATDVGVPVSATLSVFETGDMMLVLTPTLSGADAADFSVTPATLSILDGGAAQELTLVCTPAMAGTRAATLTVAHNAPGNPAFYPLRCTGGSVQTVYLPLVMRN